MRQQTGMIDEDVNLWEFDIFNGLTVPQMDHLKFKVEYKKLKRGSIVFEEGHRINGVYLIVSGILKTYITGFDGKEQIIRFEKKGDLLGYSYLINEEVAATTSKVINDAIVSYLPGDTLITLFKTNSEFAMNLMKLACSELGNSNRYLTKIAQKTVRERLAEVLIVLMETFDVDQDGTLKIALTREEIANLVGTATESVIRLLSEFKSSKLIELNGRKVKLLNVPKLIKIGNVYS